MNDRVFVDTNVLVYSRDSSEPGKQTAAAACLAALWRTRCGRISIQVLNEYYVTVTRKLDPGLPSEEAWEDVTALMTWEPVPLESGLLKLGRQIETAYSLSWWDSLIVAAAQEAGCTTIYSEDLSSGQRYNGIEVFNPLC